jgi:hypothetical protein
MADAAGSSPALLEPANTPSPEITYGQRVPGCAAGVPAGIIGRQVAYRLIASFLQFGGDGFRRVGAEFRSPGPASATGEPVPAAVSPWLRGGGGGRVQCVWSPRCLLQGQRAACYVASGRRGADHVSLQPDKSLDRLSEAGRRPIPQGSSLNTPTIPRA